MGFIPDRYGVSSVSADVFPKVTSRWGSRLYLKFAGFEGNTRYMGNIFRVSCPNQTRCIYESSGSICNWSIQGVKFPFFNYRGGEDINAGIKRFTDSFLSAAAVKAYIVMMWTSD